MLIPFAMIGDVPDTGYSLGGSGDFSGATARLTRTPSGLGTNAKILTMSFWVKKLSSTSDDPIVGCSTGSNAQGLLQLSANSDQLRMRVRNSSSSTRTDIRTTQAFADAVGWTHIVLVWDTTEAASTNRVKMYKDGVISSGLNLTNYPSLNETPNGDSFWSGPASPSHIGRDEGVYADVILSDMYFIDGAALSPTDFAEDILGTWTPKLYAGSYGVNGFRMEFADSGDLGLDTSGNGNNFTNTGVTQSLDSPTNPL